MSLQLRFRRDRPVQVRPHYGAQREHARPHEKRPGVQIATFENYTQAELISTLEGRPPSGALHELLNRYRIQRNFPDLSNFRMGPNMFSQTALDWIAFSEGARAATSELIAHGVTTRIKWDGNPASLPRGWMATVRQSYVESMLSEERPTTLIGLLIFAEKAYREHGWAADVADAMKAVARQSGLRDLIIPLRLPTRYELANVETPYEEFALAKRDDGQYRDHWLRMHVRLGAEVIGVCAVSHQHAMHPEDLRDQFDCPLLERSGSYVARSNDEYYRVHVDLEQGFAVINEGCVWVRHNLT